MSITRLTKLKVEKFRALEGVELEFGNFVTVICGKNGTSKSSILGIAAQIFSFDTDYSTGEKIEYETVAGTPFKSQYSEHFRISSKFDKPGSMKVNVELFDGYTKSAATGNLVLTRRDDIPRPVVRANSTAPIGKQSRNFTHPVIYLSLKRLYPITDREYNPIDFDYLQQHHVKFKQLTNNLLNKSSSSIAATTGIINSAVAYGKNYDQDSVSAGEDNAGQLALALLSFRKLKEEYPGYKGGLLLIDEADAGLFPAAQIKLIDILEKECHELQIQVVMTTHSPVIIQHTYEKGLTYRRNFKTVFLTDSFGRVRIENDVSWDVINADLLTRTIPIKSHELPPKINIYFEDREAQDLFNRITYRKFNKKHINILDVSLGCRNYLQLVKANIPEFHSRSIVCLDGDVDKSETNKYQSVVPLPGNLGPDQLIFEYLYNLPPEHEIWQNSINFTRFNLTLISQDLRNRLDIDVSDIPINLKERIDAYAQKNGDKEGKKKLRKLFKDFYNHEDFQQLLNLKESKYNPWLSWIAVNNEVCEKFLNDFVEQFKKIWRNEFQVSEDQINSTFVRIQNRASAK